MDELRRLYSTHVEIRPFIDSAIETIKREAARYDDSETGFFTQGLEVDRWLEHPDETPDIGYLLSSTLSHPLIFLCQMANYISVLLEGIDQDRLLANTHSVTGFSTGVVASVLVSMGLPLDRLQELALTVQGMFFWQGVRCQQSMYRFGARPEIKAESLDSAEGSPSCMASVNAIKEERLLECVQSFSEYGVVHPAYELFPDRWIVAGLPENLTAFGKFLDHQVEGVELKYIPSTIAAHCPFLNYALETSPVDAEQLGLDLRAADLNVPVWSNDMGKDLRESDNIIQDVMRAYFTRLARWSRQIAPLTGDSGISYVLDFGPGPGVASLTENYIRGSDIQVIRCTVPLGRKMLFSKVLPSLS
jgi:malonyl CoA-acyl carrier protein transacylase